MNIKRHSLIMAAVQGGLFFAVGAGLTAALMFPNFSVEGKISPLAAAFSITTAAFFAGIIAAFGAVNTARKDYLEGKIQLEDPGTQAPLPRKPMFLVPTLDVTVQWLPFAGLTYAIAFGAFGDGIPRLPFVALGAALLGLHSGLCAYRNSGRELKKYALNPPGEPSPFLTYAFREHVSGNALINLFINFIITYAIFHSPEAPGAPVPLSALVPDMLVLAFLVSVLVPIGAAMQAFSDVREKRAVPPTSSAPSLLTRNLILISAAEALALIILAAIYLAGKDAVSIYAAMTIKAVFSALIGGGAGFMTARWSAAAAAKH